MGRLDAPQITVTQRTAVPRNMVRAVVALLAVLALIGCSNMTKQQQRALSGGAIGAAAGAGIAALTGGSVLLGGALGGAGGAAIGALTH